MLIESSPANLDPRIGTDAQAEHIDSLMFDALVRRDEHFGLQPFLATKWDTPDPLTWVFHLRTDVHFHDGRPLTSRDVKWTIDSIMNGTVISVKAGSFTTLDHIDAPDPATVIFHLRKPDPSLPFNLCDGAIGIVPYGSGRDFSQHPIGSGPFQFVSQQLDRDVILARAPTYWGTRPNIPRIVFSVVPDATTRALELEKGSADVESNALPADEVYALGQDKRLVVDEGPGTVLNYIVFNTRDPILRDVRVRTAIALAINRPLIIQTLYRGEARLAESLLPPQHWAWTGNTDQHAYDPAVANALLDQAGYPRGPDGIRLHIGMKTSNDETVRLVSVAIQEQLAQVGIALDLRSYEFATFYADLTRGAFQLAPSRWIGGNENPDIFRYAYATAAFPPHGANRGFYSNPEMDRLIADASATSDRQRQRDDYVRIQQIAARDLPSLNLWYLDAVVVHDRRLSNIHPNPSGTFDFLRDATLQPESRVQAAR
ncbi:MAG TPA: ABC transporter substrate-binding protein [Acidobacteriaceae bacterium]|jgi:peptide/nickel transport system substrate-binding protein|nr:ABC transporter substrate-binding protein [Acidobacteriaceae bacterium]